MEQGNVTEIVVGALSFPHSYIYKDMRYAEYNVAYKNIGSYGIIQSLF